MIEKFEALLDKGYNLTLTDYKVCHSEFKKSKFLLPGMSLFLVILILFFVVEFVDIIILGIAFLLLVIVPIALKKGDKHEMLVVTPEHIIQQSTKSEVIAIAFNDIKKFISDKNGIIIRDTKDMITLDPHSIQDDILIIIEILEAKGKTFDKMKDYMVRPIDIFIRNNEISMKDVVQEESSTEKLVAANYKDYAMLTPGFIKDIILMNAVVDHSHKQDGNFFINLSSFEVKPGHPENTMFESQIADDCVMIFEDVKMLNITKKVVRGAQKDTEIEATIDNLVGEIEKGVITDWKYLKNKIEIQFSVGVSIVRASYKYKEIIVGWNKFR